MLSRDLLVFQRPLLNFARSTNERMAIVSVCAGFAVLQSAFTDGGASLFIALAACAAAVIAELAVNLQKGRLCLHDGSSIVTALVLTLFLPNTINPAFAAAGTLFAVLVVKHGFGGLGANWFNPAIGGWLFIRFSWPNMFTTALQASPLAFISNWMIENSNVQGESPVSILGKNGFGTQNGEVITSFLNKTLLSFFDIELPAAYLDFFLNPGTGLIADRGIFALLAGSIIMVATMVGRSYLSALYLAVLLIFVRLAGAFPFGGAAGAGDMLFCLFTGGTLASALFLVAESSAGPKSTVGRLCYAAAAAMLCFFFRYERAESCAAIFAFAVLNCLAPLIRMMEERCYYERSAYERNS